MTPLLPLVCLAVAAGLDATPCGGPLRLHPACGANCAAATVDYYPQPGDILLFQPDPVIGRVMNHLILCGKVSHAGVIVARPDGTAALLETPVLGACVQMNDPAARVREHKGAVWVRRRCMPLTPEQSAALTAFACAQLGKPYDFAKLILMPFLRPLQVVPKVCTGPHALDANRWFCSSLVVAALASAHVIDPARARPCCTSPSDLMQDCLLDLSDGWEKPVPVDGGDAPACGRLP